jgi:transposase
LPALDQEIRLVKKRFGLRPDILVFSCYEAGREAFWLHRYLTARGIENLVVVDAASLEVKQRRRRLKTDQVDLTKLLWMPVRYHAGEKGVWSVVRIPSAKAEDQCHLHRERWTPSDECISHINRIKSLLATHGVYIPVRKGFPESLKQARTWDNFPWPARLIPRLLREYQRLQLVKGQMDEVEQQPAEALRHSEDPGVVTIRHLMHLRAIRVHTAWPLAMELFNWRRLKNGRKIGGLVWPHRDTLPERWELSR